MKMIYYAIMAFKPSARTFWVDQLMGRGYREQISEQIIQTTELFCTSLTDTYKLQHSRVFKLLSHHLALPDRNPDSLISPVEIVIGVADTTTLDRQCDLVTAYGLIDSHIVSSGLQRINQVLAPYRVGRVTLLNDHKFSLMEFPKTLLAPGEKIGIDRYFARYYAHAGLDYLAYMGNPETIATM
jgi:hypothetical protein